MLPTYPIALAMNKAHEVLQVALDDQESFYSIVLNRTNVTTLIGASGSGKTMCAVGIVQTAIRYRWSMPPDQYRMFYTSGLEAASELERNRFNDESDFDAIIKNTGLLVIDDFTHGVSEKHLALLCAIVCTRSDKQKATILTDSSLARLKSIADERLMRRVVQGKVFYLGA